MYIFGLEIEYLGIWTWRLNRILESVFSRGGRGGVEEVWAGARKRSENRESLG